MTGQTFQQTLFFTNWIRWFTSLKCLRTPNTHIHVRRAPRVSKIIPGLTKSATIQVTNYDEKIFLILLRIWLEYYTKIMYLETRNLIYEQKDKCIYRITEKILTSNMQMIPAHKKSSME